MTSNRYGVIGASVTEESQSMWVRFRLVSKTLGLPITRSLEQAAQLWLDKNTSEDGAPRLHNPFKDTP